MADLNSLTTNLKDARSSLEYLLSSKGLYTPMDLPYCNGPYTRSVAYKRASQFSNCRVFKFHDGVDKFYLVDVTDNSGRLLYDSLCTHRSLIKRLEKEIDKL